MLSVENRYWESVRKTLIYNQVLPKNKYLTLFRNSIAKYKNDYFVLSRLMDGQEVFICISDGKIISSLGELIWKKVINEDFIINVFPTDASVVDNFCREINPGKGPQALGAVSRLGIGVRMSTAVWPGIWSALTKKSFSSNAIQNSLRELNLLDDLRKGKPQKKNYLFSFGEVEEGHTGSTFEGLWVYGVLDSLKYKINQKFGADADHIQIKKGKGIERAKEVIKAARYYSFYTLDVSDILNYSAIYGNVSGEKYLNIIEDESERKRIINFHVKKNKVLGLESIIDKALIGRLIGKYWEALNTLEELNHYILNVRDGKEFDLELSIDETPPELDIFKTLTSESEVAFIINEAQRRGIGLTHIAPNFGIEKGVDYRCPGGLDVLKERVIHLHQIASNNNIMLDCHSGDDLKSETRKIFGEATNGNIHYKVSPMLQNIFAETLFDYDHKIFYFWWDATFDYVKQKANEGLEFAVKSIKKFNNTKKHIPSPYHDLFQYYSYAIVGLRDSNNNFILRDKFYSLPSDFYNNYQSRVEKYLLEIANDIFLI